MSKSKNAKMLIIWIGECKYKILYVLCVYGMFYLWTFQVKKEKLF